MILFFVWFFLSLFPLPHSLFHFSLPSSPLLFPFSLLTFSLFPSLLPLFPFPFSLFPSLLPFFPSLFRFSFHSCPFPFPLSFSLPTPFFPSLFPLFISFPLPFPLPFSFSHFFLHCFFETQCKLIFCPLEKYTPLLKSVIMKENLQETTSGQIQ